jgi:hypothetical protein
MGDTTLDFSASKSNIKRRFYRVYMRATTTAVVAGDYDNLTHWTTFLATFDYIGYHENKNCKAIMTPNEFVEIDLGEEISLGWEGSIEIKFLESTPAIDTALTEMAGIDCDMLFVDDTNHKFTFIANKRFNIGPNLSSGEVEHTMIRHKQQCSAITDYFHTRAAIPTS